LFVLFRFEIFSRKNKQFSSLEFRRTIHNRESNINIQYIEILILRMKKVVLQFNILYQKMRAQLITISALDSL
jgi:hypothetical protein